METNYEYFVRTEKEKVRKYFNELHECFEKKNTLFNMIVKHRDFLEFNGMSYTRILKLYNLEYKEYRENVHDMFVHTLPDDLQHLQLVTNVRAFVHLCTKKIHVLRRLIDYHSMLYCIPEDAFTAIIGECNKLVVNQILIGNVMPMINHRETLKINRYDRNFNRRAINYKESKEHWANGGKGAILHLDDEYLAVKYKKTKAAPACTRPYRFKFTAFMNKKDMTTLEYYDTVKTVHEILESDGVGNLEKMLAIKHLKGINFYNKNNGIQSSKR